MEHNQPHLEGMSQREVLEMQEPALLLEYKKALLEKYSDIEADINLVNDVLDGYGVDSSTDYDDIPDNVIYVDFQGR